MGKRKQADFQKTKLRVGRQLPKGANVTDTSFKTKQIITPDQSFVALADKPLTVILRYLNTKNLAQKLDALGKVHIYIKEHKDTLSLYFPEILAKLGKAALESDPKVTELAAKVITTCLKLLTDVQYKTFCRCMLLHLNCMMSHGAITVKQCSLKVLEAILATHPKVVTRQPSILFNLMNMISSLKSNQVRKLDDSVNNMVASYSWHQEVLQTIHLFLQAMIEPGDADDEESEEGVVYWDGKSELFLPLYAARGPVKVDLSWYAIMADPEDVQLKKFVFEMLDLLSDVIRGKIPRIARKQEDVILSATDANYLKLVVQLLCYAGEVAQHLQLEGNDVQIMTKQFQDISVQLLNGFPYAEHGNVIPSRSSNEGKEPECIQLNASICYLSAMFIFDSVDAKLNAQRRAVLKHMSCVLTANTDLSDKSVLFYLKSSRMLLKSKYVNLNYKEGVLQLVHTIFTRTNIAVQCKMLFSFFSDISLDKSYSDILSCTVMTEWFKAVFNDLTTVTESGNIKMKMLNYIKQMCCRKYPEFMEVLNTLDENILIKLLCYDHEDYQITVIHLILAKDKIPSSFLNDLSNLICQNDAITLKMSTRLIYHLHTRYSRYGVPELEKLYFVKFLINTACDTRSLHESDVDFENIEVLDVMFSCLSKTDYRMFPTKKWKTHQKIFEVCLELLLSYRELKSVEMAILLFAQTFLRKKHESIPVHVILAFLLVRQKLGYMFCDNEVITSSYTLMFSSFMYISVMISEAKDQAKLYCVPELQNCLLAFLKPLEVTHIIRCNHAVFTSLPENEFYHALKIVMFLTLRSRIDTQDPYIKHFLNDLHNISSQSLVVMPVWNKICSALE